MDSDEYEVIEVDYGSDTSADCIDNSDKENTDHTPGSTGSTHKLKVKKEQFQIISSAMTNEDLLDKNALKDLWSRLTSELNTIGPPTFSMLQWRRKWTQYKYNKKRRSSNDDTDLLPSLQILDQPSLNELPPLPPVEASVTADSINVSSEVLANVNIIKQNQAVIKVKLDQSNSLLEQILKKFS